MGNKIKKNKELCLNYLLWFSDYIKDHGLLISNNILANTDRYFEYEFIEVPTDSEQMEFWCRFVFKFKHVDKVVTVPYIRLRCHKDDIYTEALENLTRHLIYGIDFLDIGKILTGRSVINWQDDEENHYTLLDLINEQNGK